MFANVVVLRDRDGNAAINILNLALGTTGHVGTWILNLNATLRERQGRTGDLSSTILGASLSQQAESLNEESPHL